jgi:hypothetical protein
LHPLNAYHYSTHQAKPPAPPEPHPPFTESEM